MPAQDSGILVLVLRHYDIHACIPPYSHTSIIPVLVNVAGLSAYVQSYRAILYTVLTYYNSHHSVTGTVLLPKRVKGPDCLKRTLLRYTSFWQAVTIHFARTCHHWQSLEWSDLLNENPVGVYIQSVTNEMLEYRTSECALCLHEHRANHHMQWNLK